MRIGSIFSGIGGLEKGLELADIGTTIWQIEQNEHCREVLARHWPRANRSITDVREAGPHNLEPIDLLCGGPPCQPASVAGKRQGSGDKRWLWGEALRLTREFQPRVCVFENPTGLISLDGGRAFYRIIQEIASLGYVVSWHRLRASDAGAPHRRERVFIVGVADAGCCRVQRRADG